MNSVVRGRPRIFWLLAALILALIVTHQLQVHIDIDTIRIMIRR